MLTFAAGISYYSPHLLLNVITIAPFWDDIDTTTAGHIFLRFSIEESLVEEVGNNISNAFDVRFSPTVLFIVTWNEVAPLSGSGTLVSS